MKEDTFFRKAERIIRRIPYGKVATYGQIAALAGSHRASRAVIRVLHTSKGLPWHRVINSRGEISLKPPDGGEEQRDLLEGEGVEFRLDGKVDLRMYLWDPDRNNHSTAGGER